MKPEVTTKIKARRKNTNRQKYNDFVKNNKNKSLNTKPVTEYTGTGASGFPGGKGGDGNRITSPRPFDNERKEMKSYTNKNVGYGGDGGHYVNEPAARGTLTRDPRGGMFELKKYIKQALKEIEEQAYGSATLTTQGQQAGRGIGVQEDEEEVTEQVSAAAQKTYEAGLKRLQKQVLRYQL